MVDYNCVIKCIHIENDEGIWSQDEAVQYITKNYDIKTLPYGQVIHVYNPNGCGDEWNEYYIVYDGKLEYTHGDQYFRLHYSFTKNITDICAKYTEFSFDDTVELHMSGEIRNDDPYVLENFGKVEEEIFDTLDDHDDIKIKIDSDSDAE